MFHLENRASKYLSSHAGAWKYLFRSQFCRVLALSLLLATSSVNARDDCFLEQADERYLLTAFRISSANSSPLSVKKSLARVHVALAGFLKHDMCTDFISE